MGTQKPPPGAVLNRGHALTSGMDLALLLNEGGGRQVFNHAAQTVLTSASVPGWTRGGVQGTLGALAVPDPLPARSTESWVFEFEQRGPATGIQHVLGHEGRLLTFRWIGTEMQIPIWTTGLQIFASGNLTLINGRVYRVAVTFDNGALKVYSGGAQVYSATTAGSTLVASTDHLLYIGTKLGGEQTSAVVRHAYRWSRVLSPDEVRLLASEPYAMFRGAGDEPKV